jgi:hypothetical protein
MEALMEDIMLEIELRKRFYNQVFCSDLILLKMMISMLFSASPWINASTHSLRCNIKKTKVILLHHMIQQLHKKLYNAHSIELSEFTMKT